MTNKVIDLFSGLGGFSEAFVMSGKYEVERYDNNTWLAEVPHTQMCDLTKYAIGTAKKPFLLLGSPPCLEFSNAYDAPKIRAKRLGLDYEPSVELVEIFKEHIDRLQPQYWMMENVIGSIDWITPILGEPVQIIGPFVFWGNVPLLDLSMEDRKQIRGAKKKQDKRHSPIRSNHRARIPLQISTAILRAVESPTLENWL
jgi:site-specific DNA-cytosine methylase